MARIAGVDLPNNKQGEIGLTYIYGIGRSSAKRILKEAGVELTSKVSDWNDDQLNKIRKIITEEFKVEGALRSETQLNIKRLIDIGNDSRTGRSGVSSVDPKRPRKRSAAGSGRQSGVLRGERLVMKPLNASIRRVGNDPKGSGDGYSSRERGSQVLATGFGLRIRQVSASKPN